MTDSSGDAYARLADALTDPDRLYDRGQLAFLMASALRWGAELTRAEMIPDEPAYATGWLAGYEDAHAELTARAAAPYPPPPYLIVHGVKIGGDQVAERARVAGDRSQRWAGGTADEAMARFMWEPDRPDFEVAPGRLYVRMHAGSIVWDEDRITASMRGGR